MKAPAKINLHLEITGKREDGYHEIKTIFAPLRDLYDDVTVEPSTNEKQHDCLIKGLSLNLPKETDNICLKATNAFCRTFNDKKHYRIKLDKRIPVSAGLGGGSSDAAAVLLQLCQINGISADNQSIRDIAVSLGADVPFFLSPAIMAATGIGENLTPIFPDDRHRNLNRRVVIVYPKFPSPVAVAYKLADERPCRSTRTMEEVIEQLQKNEFPKDYFRNDLGEALAQKFPLLDCICDELFCCGAIAPSVSGSGSSVFALMPEKWNEFFENRITQKINEKFAAMVFFSSI